MCLFLQQMETLTWLLALFAVGHCANQFYGAGREYGRISARLRDQAYRNAQNDRAQQQRDSNRFDGNAEQQAR